MPGTLFVVATPIGNLEDLSFRALRTLREVDLIAAEDTRRTAKLLAHYEIRKPMVSLHEHNEHREAPKLVARLRAGESIALVSDAGTPGISDPGEHLVRAVREANLPVVPIPGASAIATALSISGFPASQFVFMGFPPRSGPARLDWLERLAGEPRTVAFFEAPHRISRTVDDLRAYLVDRQIIINRELTKINEQSVIQPTNTAELATNDLGEFVVVVEPKPDIQAISQQSAQALDMAVAMVGCMTEFGNFEQEQAERLASVALSLDQRRVKTAVKKSKIAKKQRGKSLS